mmetsp:Transcript_1618/g.3710  ORF Transcript_1618/g.3710 Transcript_1618/m.3710 type:complete len:219 (-) Transcript_1618:29-685(-)
MSTIGGHVPRGPRCVKLEIEVRHPCVVPHGNARHGTDALAHAVHGGCANVGRRGVALARDETAKIAAAGLLHLGIIDRPAGSCHAGELRLSDYLPGQKAAAARAKHPETALPGGNQSVLFEEPQCLGELRTRVRRSQKLHPDVTGILDGASEAAADPAPVGFENEGLESAASKHERTQRTCKAAADHCHSRCGRQRCRHRRRVGKVLLFSKEPILLQP